MGRDGAAKGAAALESGGGGADAAQAVFAAHYPGLVRHLSYLLDGRAAAEDIAQEAFLRLLARPPRDWADPGPWLRLVGRRLALNYLRGERRRAAREDRLWRIRALGGEDEMAGPPGDAAEARDERAAVRRALRGLQPRDRLALLLRAAGCEYAEIAAAIAVRPSSVGSLLARATARLRAAYLADRPGAGPAGASMAIPSRPLSEGGLEAHDALR